MADVRQASQIGRPWGEACDEAALGAVKAMGVPEA
jgi:hypothetical protein